jgi:SanA protein
MQKPSQRNSKVRQNAGPTINPHNLPDLKKKRMKIVLAVFIFFLLIFLGGIIAVAIMNLVILNSARPYVYSISNVPAAHTAIVPGCFVDEKGNLSDMLFDRLKTAVQLYQQGKVKKILLTGDHGIKSYDEVNSMRKTAEKMGVPPEDIFMDHAGFCTYESMYRARDVFRVKSAIIVTQKFHLSRSIYIARKLGIEAVGVPADSHRYMDVEYNENRETLARVKAFIQVNVTRPLPTFLGEVIPITGDGRKTHDLPGR